MLFRSKTRSAGRAPAPPAAARSRTAQQRPSLLQCATVLTLASLCSAFPAQAQDQIDLKFTHRFSSKHYAWTHGGGVFTQAVESASAGRVKFETYPAAQLGKDYFSLLRSGLADIAVFIPAYESDKLPMSTVVELPNMYSNICQGARTLASMVSDSGSIGRSEYSRHGLHVLFVTLMPPYTFMTSKQPTTSLETMAGLKIRGSGAAMTKTVQALDAVPVQISASEVYEALSRGTVDGAVYPYNALTPYALEDQLKYSVDGVSLGGTAVVYAISSKKWNALPAEVKTIMNQAAQATQASMCQWLDEENVRIRQQIVRDSGHIVTQLPAEDLARLTQAMQQVRASWAQVMDAAHHDGSALLEEYQQLFAASQP
ncbi:TRAP transporter substrate-binding protein DctP [Pseudomonas sp. zfem002]|uniref:TRAP transporter substrate-binding protein n=1 Tax=Pseudomonas sp. zfem002 TaxID=3078197 RepID=UPI00292882B7|nr:TRAP transporter substrate-binding protein DctP [Pseudomonas sp. zfem002]MDU9394708.1 TRAP transporter substrate-binding protein DctP [Pseudomonas sp. zfem002]